MSIPDKKSSFPFKVYVRQRPFTKTEIEQKCSSIVHHMTHKELSLKLGYNEKKYTFDHVFGGEASQVQVYNVTVAPLIASILTGYNCTLFAYGQTGTGKTHTIVGEVNELEGFNFQTDTSAGLILRASHHLFSELSKVGLKTEYTIRVSFIEIYNEEVRDLLNQSLPLRVYDDPLNKGSVCIKDLVKATVFNTEDVFNWLKIGLNERQNAATNSNLQSSRSHTLFTFLINIREVTSKGEEIIKTGRLYLVDLAGSENIGRSGAVDVRAREAGTINRSLISLNKVIKALGQRTQHIPFRDSKLTRILQDSLGGNSKTAMIATFSPNRSSWDETTVTLELAQLAKTIINYPQVHVDKKQANLLKELHDEISKLREELSAARAGEGFYVSAEAFQKMTQEDQDNNKKILQLTRQIVDLEQHSHSLEEQNRNLTQSFAKTKKYLEEQKKALEAVHEDVRRGQHRLREMSSKHCHLSETANTLLNICENATKNEEILHQKYQDKCAANTNNAKVTQEMSAAALSCVDNVRVASQKCLNHGLCQTEHMKNLNVHLQQNHLANLQKFNDLSREIRNRLEDYKLQVQRIITSTTEQYCAQNVQGFVGQTYDQSLQQQQKYAKVVLSLEKLKNDVAAKVEELQTKSDQVFAALKDVVRDSEDSRTKARAFALSLKNHLSEREKQVKEQLRSEQAMIAVSKSEYARAEREEQILMREAEVVDQQLKHIQSLIALNRSRKQQKQAVRQNVTDYILRANQVLPIQKPTVQRAIDDLNQNHVSLVNQGAEGRDSIRQYMTGFNETGQENLTQNKNEFGLALQGWGSAMVNLDDDVMEHAKKTAASIENSLNQVQVIVQKQHNDVNTYVDESINAVKTYNDLVTPLGHAGDTPVKIKSPRKITGGLRRELLEARMNGGADDKKTKNGANKEN